MNTVLIVLVAVIGYVAVIIALAKYLRHNRRQNTRRP